MFCSAGAPGLQAPANSPDSEREKDVYLIYSLMLTNPRTSHGPDNNERYLIAATTAPGRPPEPCVIPPKEREADFRDVLADYEHWKGKPRELKPAFSIRKPYLLLNADGVKTFMKERWPTPEPKLPDARFRGVTDIFTLSDVYFNQRQTLALTAISTWCGSLFSVEGVRKTGYRQVGRTAVGGVHNDRRGRLTIGVGGVSTLEKRAFWKVAATAAHPVHAGMNLCGPGRAAAGTRRHGRLSARALGVLLNDGAGLRRGITRAVPAARPGQRCLCNFCTGDAETK